MFWVYVLWSERLQKYYVGSTNDLSDRLHRHNTGQEKFSKKGIPWQLIWQRTFETRPEAYRLEMKIKARGIKRYLDDIQFNENSPN